MNRIPRRISNGYDLPLELMAPVERFNFPNFDVYQADHKSLHTPLSWDNEPLEKIAYIEHSSTKVCATCRFGVFNQEDEQRFYLNVINSLGEPANDQNYLIVTTDFPVATQGLSCDDRLAERGGAFFLALRHPNPEFRTYMQNWLRERMPY